MTADRRSAILAAATDLIRENGVAAVRTRDVTTRAGVGIGLLNHYFKWGELRALAAAQALWAEIERVVPEAPAPDRQLDVFLARAFGEDADPLWRLWIEVTDLAMSDPDMARAAEGCAEGILNELAAILEQGAAKHYWQCPAPKAAALRILAFHDGLVGFVLTGLPKVERDEAAEHFKRFVALELGLPQDSHKA
ncbi:MAG: TetR family transcriptional regulator C-terminal domain-containing protein [Yoonia sp.]|uniref:TetR/AcrR family transcriptional regulator n=1 Tax=Yoonia sp. TaxID=2212373 RepID=UPI00273E6625|nr:TetR family transcriptional regulator C-terminal domain-containing protein [Yoonia sp.]MDP5085450.1 TetR family transcriptional regulator C-terminal domain-containing protein [Yoonia sp.]MDP5362515.1 TetR family transcriptional regulator C-terminal domain-containing protein [Paracoccaceae bacterium]